MTRDWIPTWRDVRLRFLLKWAWRFCGVIRFGRGREFFRQRVLAVLDEPMSERDEHRFAAWYEKWSAE